jgi:hypothetical protein
MGNMEIILFVFSTLLTVIGFMAVNIMGGMKSEMQETKIVAIELKENVQELSIQLAVVIKEMEHHDGRISKIEGKIGV